MPARLQQSIMRFPTNTSAQSAHLSEIQLQVHNAHLRAHKMQIKEETL